MEGELEKPLDAAFAEMLYRQDRIYYESRAPMTKKTPRRDALDAAYQAFKVQMQECTTVDQLDALEAIDWRPE
jgi:hypothetical protein